MSQEGLEQLLLREQQTELCLCPRAEQSPFHPQLSQSPNQSPCSSFLAKSENQGILLRFSQFSL